MVSESFDHEDTCPEAVENELHEKILFGPMVPFKADNRSYSRQTPYFNRACFLLPSFQNRKKDPLFTTPRCIPDCYSKGFNCNRPVICKCRIQGLSLHQLLHPHGFPVVYLKITAAHCLRCPSLEPPIHQGHLHLKQNERQTQGSRLGHIPFSCKEQLTSTSISPSFSTPCWAMILIISLES